MGGRKQVKICKKDEKKQLKCLIKILRPKVYITDSSSFKTLVQELTGNGINNNRPPLQPPPISSPPAAILELDHEEEEEEEDTLILEDINHHQHQQSSSSLQMISGSSSSCSPQAELSVPAVPEMEDFSLYNDIESWLLDMDMDPFFLYNHHDGYVSTIQPEVCNYDYHLAGII